MKRRGFFAALAGLAAGALVPWRSKSKVTNDGPWRVLPTKRGFNAGHHADGKWHLYTLVVNCEEPPEYPPFGKRGPVQLQMTTVDVYRDNEFLGRRYHHPGTRITETIDGMRWVFGPDDEGREIHQWAS